MCESHRHGGGGVAVLDTAPTQPKKPNNRIIDSQESERLIGFLEEGNPSKISAAGVVKSMREKLASIKPENQTDELALQHSEDIVLGLENQDLSQDSLRRAVGVVKWLVEKGLE